MTVKWYTWTEEIFKKAKIEDKPILLDLGATWCHWCHVLDRESYQDKETSEIINKNFIPVKVDRDQRPDIDKIYQEAVSKMTGQGGWPLTVFLLPNKKPFFGGTYFPKEDSHGLPSFKRVLANVLKMYEAKKAPDLTIKTEERKNILSKEKVNSAVNEILKSVDNINGGFGHTPKFFNAEALDFLMISYNENNNLLDFF